MQLSQRITLRRALLRLKFSDVDPRGDIMILVKEKVTIKIFFKREFRVSGKAYGELMGKCDANSAKHFTNWVNNTLKTITRKSPYGDLI